LAELVESDLVFPTSSNKITNGSRGHVGDVRFGTFPRLRHMRKRRAVKPVVNQ
jgi:hypothetical protein